MIDNNNGSSEDDVNMLMHIGSPPYSLEKGTQKIKAENQSKPTGSSQISP